MSLGENVNGGRLMLARNPAKALKARRGLTNFLTCSEYNP